MKFWPKIMVQYHIATQGNYATLDSYGMTPCVTVASARVERGE